VKLDRTAPSGRLHRLVRCKKLRLRNQQVFMLQPGRRRFECFRLSDKSGWLHFGPSRTSHVWSRRLVRTPSSKDRRGSLRNRRRRPSQASDSSIYKIRVPQSSFRSWQRVRQLADRPYSSGLWRRLPKHARQAKRPVEFYGRASTVILPAFS